MRRSEAFYSRVSKHYRSSHCGRYLHSFKITKIGLIMARSLSPVDLGIMHALISRYPVGLDHMICRDLRF